MTSKLNEAVERLPMVLEHLGDPETRTWHAVEAPYPKTYRELRAGLMADLVTILSALKVWTEALEEIKRGGFNCSPHQWFMAAQGRAEAALSLDPEDTP